MCVDSWRLRGHSSEHFTSKLSCFFSHKISLHLHQLRPVGSETESLVITCVTVHHPSLQERQAKQQEELRKQQRKQVEMEVLKKKEDEARLVGFLLKLTHHVQRPHQYCCPPQHLTASLASSASWQCFLMCTYMHTFIHTTHIQTFTHCSPHTCTPSHMHTFTHCREHSEQFAAEQGEREKEEAQAKKQQLAERLRLREEQRRRREAVREFTIKQIGVLQARLIFMML